MWTRLSLPLAVGAAWFGGLSWHLGNAVPFLAGPLSACLYAALWVAVPRCVRLRLNRLKLADTVLLALSAAGAGGLLSVVAPSGAVWVPATGLFPVIWCVNWLHGGAPGRPGEGAVPEPPPFALPPVTGPITAGYRSYDRSHTGVDVGVPVGTPVVCPAEGAVVLHAGPLEQWGHTVILDHGQGWTSLYAHLDAPAVRRGERVGVGEVIGFSGTTGISTGPHVHVELRYRGVAVNPAPLAGAEDQ